MNFDVQKVLNNTPKMFVSDAYYRRKLLNYNITTYDLSTRCVKCFVWNETEGIVVAAKYQLAYIQYDAKSIRTKWRRVYIRNEIRSNLRLQYFVSNCK